MIESVCIVPYLLIWAIASFKLFTDFTETTEDKYSLDQSLLEAFLTLPLYDFIILLSPIILHPLSSKLFKIELPIFFIICLCNNIVSVAPQIAVFLNFAL